MRHGSLVSIILWLLLGPSSPPFFMKSFNTGNTFTTNQSYLRYPTHDTYYTYNTIHNHTLTLLFVDLHI